jgi:hypothetical protein
MFLYTAYISPQRPLELPARIPHNKKYLTTQSKPVTLDHGQRTGRLFDRDVRLLPKAGRN